MRYKISFLLLFSFLLCGHLQAQKVTVHVFNENKMNKPGSDTIYYNFNEKLKWADFQGKVPPADPWGAMTASGFSFNSSLEDDDGNITILVGVYTFFSKRDSWKKPSVNSAYHLEHEQHHFDITRLGAEELAKELSKAHFTRSNYHSLLNTIFNKVYAENVALQREYDKETKNSLDQAGQLEWNKKITAQIKELQASRSVASEND
jgi:hypothetical protein